MIGQFEFVEETCVNCGMPFAITRDFYNALRNCHNVFYCPRGHPQHYTSESDVEKERRMRKVVQAERDALAAELAKLKARRKTAAKKKVGKNERKS
jgi:hypothetical protein